MSLKGFLEYLFDYLFSKSRNCYNSIKFEESVEVGTYKNRIGWYFQDRIRDILGVMHNPGEGADLVSFKDGFAPTAIEVKSRMTKYGGWSVDNDQVRRYPKLHRELEDGLWWAFAVYDLACSVGEVRDEDDFMKLTSNRRVYLMRTDLVLGYRVDRGGWRNVRLRGVTEAAKGFVEREIYGTRVFIPPESSLTPRLERLLIPVPF